MSESENLNFDLPSGKHSGDAEQVLNDLLPQPLEINRDDLFFQAGFAAGITQVGAKNSLSPWERAGVRVPGVFWPSAVAALLLVCVGLGAALISDAVSMNRMQQVLAATGHASTATVTRSESETDKQVDEARTSGDRLFADRQQRSWLRLASAASLPPGRLTAAGWEEIPQSATNGESKDNPLDKPGTLRRIVRPPIGNSCALKERANHASFHPFTVDTYMRLHCHGCL